MRTTPDTSTSAVETLIKGLECDGSAERERVTAMLSALVTERDALRADVATAKRRHRDLDDYIAGCLV